MNKTLKKIVAGASLAALLTSCAGPTRNIEGETIVAPKNYVQSVWEDSSRGVLSRYTVDSRSVVNERLIDIDLDGSPDVYERVARGRGVNDTKEYQTIEIKEGYDIPSRGLFRDLGENTSIRYVSDCRAL